MFDTNVVLSALLFEGGRLAWLRTAWRTGTLVPIVSRETTLELVIALAYPKFALSAEECEMLLAGFLPFAEPFELSDHAASTPQCRDPHDQVFLDLAGESGAVGLVTSDRDLLVLKDVYERLVAGVQSEAWREKARQARERVRAERAGAAFPLAEEMIRAGREERDEHLGGLR